MTEPAGAAAGSGDAALERAQLRWLEAASLVEATTLVLLVGVAVPLKHLAGMPAAVMVRVRCTGWPLPPIFGLSCKRLPAVAGGGPSGCGSR